MSTNQVCCICGDWGGEVELRPYGKGGAPICFDCMKSSPERERTAKEMFRKRLNQIPGNEVAIVKGIGPVSIKRNLQ